MTDRIITWISADGLEKLIRDARAGRWKALILLGPGYRLGESRERWPAGFDRIMPVHQLIEHVDGLAEKVADLTGLTMLNLSGNRIGDEGAAIIAPRLEALERLDLSGNGIGPEGAKAIAEHLKHLVALDLSSNAIGDIGAAAMARPLQGVIEKAHTLCLADNDIHVDGALAIADALARGTDLRSLDLSGNWIGDRGALAVIGAAVDAPPASDIDNPGDVLKRSAQSVRDRLQSFAAIDLSWNDLREETAECIKAHLEPIRNKQGESVDLRLSCYHTREPNTVIDAELDHLLGSDRNPGASHLDRQRLIGLALSGGGIRAASFSLGVLQAMANADRLKHVHYMSTVSGGGFIGSSLSWFIGHGACRNHPDATAADGRFEAASAYFPFGAKEYAELVTRDDSSRREDERAVIDDEADDSERLRHQAAWTNAREKRAQQTRILSHIRQNGSYLNPRGGWDIIILFATMLRFLIPSFFVYFCTLLLPIAFIAYLLALGPISDPSLLHPSEDLADSEHYSRIIANNPPNAPSSLTDTARWLHYNGAWRIGGALLLTFALAALVYALFSGTPKTLTWSRSLLRSFVIFPLCLLVVFPPIVFALLFYIPQPLDIYITISLIISIVAASISYSHFVGPLILFLLNFPLIVSLDKNIFNYHDESNILAVLYYFELAIVPILYFILAKIVTYFKSDKAGKFKLLDLSLYISGSFVVFLAFIYAIDVTGLPVNTDDTAQILWISGILGALSIVVIIICLQRQATDSDDADILQDAYAIRQRARLPGAFILIFAGAFLVAGLLPVLYADVSSTIGPALTATGVAAYLGKVFVDIRDIKKTFAGFEGLLIVVACFGTVIGLLLLGFALCDLIYEAHRALGFAPTDLQESLALIVLLTALFGAAVGWQANANFVGFHRFYRDRLMQTFFPSPYRMEDTDYQAKHVEGFFVHQLRHASRAGDRRGPYHIINTNLVLTSSANARYRGRGGANFIISPLYCGSDATGWRATESWRMPAGALTLATAMAVSGAAINPQTGPSGRGPMRTPFVSFLMTLFNARLGLWLPNPDPNQAIKKPTHAPNLLIPGINQGLGGRFHREDKGFIELTDGGHFDNTGLYELIRRNVKLIIMVDGSDDKEFHCSDLASAFERIRADFGVQIRFGDDEPILKKLMHDPDKKDAYAKKLKTAEEGFAIARIDYQPHNQHPSGNNPEDGYLVIIKATMVDDLPVDVLGYKSANPHFPNETTADQFFDEIQLEAYRELGYRLGKAALGNDIVKREFAHCSMGRNGENAGQKA